MRLERPYGHGPFEGCWQRINRAATHRQTAVSEWNAFLDSEPYDSGFNIDENGKGTLWIEAIDPIPPIIAVLFGEWVYNMRVALDYALYETAIFDSGGQDPPPGAGTLQFPICSTVEEWRHRQDRLKPLSEKHRSWIEMVQPYRGTFGPEGTILYWLNDLARKDRHRALHVVGAYITEAEPEIYAPKATLTLYEGVDVPVLLNRKEVVARFEVFPYAPGDQIEANPQAAIDAEITEFTRRRGDVEWLHLPLGQRLSDMDMFIEAIVARLEYDCTGHTRSTLPLEDGPDV